jgi:hypothetical protein
MSAHVEASWGADPLEYYGGFASLNYDPESSFPSSLAADGVASWMITRVKESEFDLNHALVSLNVDFPNVDWVALQSVYGWAALQYQAWARGQIEVKSLKPCTVLLYTESILEFYIDGRPYFGGDFYGFRRAPLVLRLTPGIHTIDVRLIRDVRAMGGVGTPEISAKIEAQLTSSLIDVPYQHTIISHVIHGSLASPYASISVRNNGPIQLRISSIWSTDVCPIGEIINFY